MNRKWDHEEIYFTHGGKIIAPLGQIALMRNQDDEFWVWFGGTCLGGISHETYMKLKDKLLTCHEMGCES